MLLTVAQIVTTMLVAVAMALSLAHALELPGKLRLTKEDYFAVQPIYYPGFTIGGGVGDMGGTLATLVLLFLTPRDSLSFWLTVAAFIGLVGMQAVYWSVTHPVNRHWLRGQKLGNFSGGFFSVGKDDERPRSWTELRNRWEYSHVVRAGLAVLSLAALVTAIAVD